MIMPRTRLLPRAEKVRDAKLFIIAVEGEHTERQYFSLFGNSRVHVKVLPAGKDGLSAPTHVLQRLTAFEEGYGLNVDDERWLVCDFDRWGLAHVKSVTKIALDRHYQLALSNPCFELWLRLHFADVDMADTNCQALKSRLQDELGGYNWTNLDLSKFDAANMLIAIARSRALDKDINRRWPDFPGTHVYKLVEKLIQSIST